MKHLLILLLLACCAVPGRGQNLMIGERIPDLPVTEWLGGEQPKEAPFTFINFFHSTNSACVSSLAYLQHLVNKFGTKLQAVTVIQQSDENGAAIAAPYRSELFTVGVDVDNLALEAFGIHFVPFGLLVDAKRRVLWMGELRRLSEREFQEYIQ